MILLRSLFLAISCFSKIPVPQLTWKDEGMRFMMCFFPVVGVLVGLFLALWWWICDLLAFGMVLRAVGVTLVPLLVTGGIHLDGFCDVTDALSSHTPPERRREILKDPHVGAFAVIGVAAYLLGYFGVATELPHIWPALIVLALGEVMARCASGIATVAFPKSSSEGMLAQFHESADTRRSVIVLVIEFVVAAAAAIVACVPLGIAAAAGCLVCLAILPVFARRQFGGMSGDVAGFFLQVAMLVMLICIVVVSKAVGL